MKEIIAKEIKKFKSEVEKGQCQVVIGFFTTQKWAAVYCEQMSDIRKTGLLGFSEGRSADKFSVPPGARVVRSLQAKGRLLISVRPNRIRSP